MDDKPTKTAFAPTREYPAVLYHEDGRHVVATSAAHATTLGSGWTDKPAEKHITAIRAATGGVADVVLPVTRTVQERV